MNVHLFSIALLFLCPRDFQPLICGTIPSSFLAVLALCCGPLLSASSVVAHETSEVRFLADNFAREGVEAYVTAERLGGTPARLQRPSDFGATPKGQGVAFAVFASPKYLAQSFYELPQASDSASLVADVLEACGARSIATGLTNSARLRAADFAEARRRIIEAVKAQKPRAFVFYYVGHAVSGIAGSHYLIMGDYSNVTGELEQTSPFVPARSPQHPLAGGNIDDIAKVIAAAGQELASSRTGQVAVADIYHELNETGVPFAIVVDGCYPAQAISELKAQLPGMFWWVGDGDASGRGQTADGMRNYEYRRALRAYGEAPYLRSSNPVVFAALPGTVASMVKNPLYKTDLAPELAPLAAKFVVAFSGALLNRKALSLGEWLDQLVDFKTTAEPGSQGSISWSSFTSLRDVEVLSFGAKNGK